MRLKLFMIRLEDDKIIPLDEDDYSNIKRDDNGGRECFVTKTHFRGADKKFYSPAFKIFLDDGESDNYNLAYSADEINLTHFHKAEKFFYDPSTGRELDEVSIGSINPGVNYIHVLKNGVKVGTPHRLLVLPSSMSYREYEAMIQEIIFISRKLIQNSKSKSSLSESLRPLCDTDNWRRVLENLDRHVAEILALMKRIDTHPHYGLRRTKKFSRPAQIRRFDEKILRQYVQFPNREKYLVRDEEITYNIFENRLLKKELSSLRNFLVQKNIWQWEICRVQASNIQNKIVELQRKEQTISMNYEEKLLNDRQNEYFYNQLDLTAEGVVEDAIIERILKNLDKCLALKIFNGVEYCGERRRMTQIFTNDKNYHKVYIKLRDLDEILNFSFKADENKILNEKTDRIYEYWVLAKILEFLIVKQCWQAQDNETDYLKIFREFFSDFNSNRKFQNRSPIRLMHKLKDASYMEMEIFYDTQIKFSLGVKSYKRPDFLFKVTVGDCTKIFILDAKYRNYAEMSKTYWIKKDIKEVCAQKYIMDLKKDCDVDVSAALIVHTDKSRSENSAKIFGKYVIFNSWKKSYRQVGSFYLLPQVDETGIINQSEENLTAYFQMIFEYYMDAWKICWQCGSTNVTITEQLTGKKPKYYLFCENCGAFWVKNHCRNDTKHKLLKHYFNYHNEEGGRWFVKCPICGD